MYTSRSQLRTLGVFVPDIARDGRRSILKSEKVVQNKHAARARRCISGTNHFMVNEDRNVETAEPINLREVLRDSSQFSGDQVAVLETAACGGQIAELRVELNSLRSDVDVAGQPSETELARLGVGYYVLGKHRDAHHYLERIEGDAVATFYRAIVLVALEQFDEAADEFAEAERAGYDAVECKLRRAGAIRRAGRIDEAEKLLRATASAGATRAEYSYQMGCILSDQDDTYGAIEYFERAVDMDSHHSRALFALAGENALRGNDDEAIRLYEQSLSKPPQYMGALINLGLLYEDAENYRAAEFCFRRVLENDPTHEMARLYLKDIEATGDMYYDEDSAREETRLQQLLGRPVTDFELSVRSRNCLEHLGIVTLGDLTRINEPQLLAGKNFGETSLTEIRELLSSHGLTVGQHLNAETRRKPDYAINDLSPEERETMESPVTELNLSVRSRKCMSRLGITQIGELLSRSADELLGSKNFGVTSLNEIRAKLTEVGLSLRND